MSADTGTPSENSRSTEKIKVELRVGAGSNSRKVAFSLVRNMQEGKKVSVAAIGAGAVNQAAKALNIAQSMAASEGFYLAFTIGKKVKTIDGHEKTVLEFFPFVLSSN